MRFYSNDGLLALSDRPGSVYRLDGDEAVMRSKLA
jgi:hypothetical protein